MPARHRTCKLVLVPLVFFQLLKDPDGHPVKEGVFLAVLFALFFPLLPNLLLSTGLLAWWALPLAVLFGIVALTVRCRSHAGSGGTGSVVFSPSRELLG